MDSGEIIITLYGIAVFAVLRRSHLRRKQNRTKCLITEHPPSKDIISELPDDMLISIISRMPNKYSTRTSILSKRWRNLYKFVPDVEFRCCDLPVGCFCYSVNPPRVGYDSNLIVQIVDRFFRHRSASGGIRSFRFDCRLSKPYTNRFEAWIHSLGRLGVEELVLKFRGCRPSDTSFSYSLVYEMPSLKSLKLASCTLHMGKTQLCKCLQILILGSVVVSCGAFKCILSTCLSLHTLSFDRCYFDPNSKLSFSGPNLQLKSLYIFDCPAIEGIRLCASNLTTFEFKCPSLVDFIVDHVPKLQSIYLMTYPFKALPYIFRKLAQDLPQLKSLGFATTPSNYDTTVGINMLTNLRRLDFCLYWQTYVNLLSLIPLVQSCPFLEEFHLDTSDMKYSGPPVKKQAIVIHSKLKKVELSGFIGTQNEMEFALYMLKSAVGLELMHISRRSKYYKGFGSWMHFDESQWSQEMYNMIHTQLQGQAVSKTARVVIQYEPLY